MAKKVAEKNEIKTKPRSPGASPNKKKKKKVTVSVPDDDSPPTNHPVWIRLISRKKNHDWVHEPLEVMAKAPKPVEDEFVDCMQFVLPANTKVGKYLYVLWHFHTEAMDSCRLFGVKEEAREAFKNEMQISAQYLEKSDEHLHVVKVSETSDRWESTKYHMEKARGGSYPRISYSEDGDRWVLEKVKVPKSVRNED